MSTTEVPLAELDLTPALVSDSSLVTPAAPLAEIEEAFHAYQALCDRLLGPDDYQQMGQKNFRKKSAWRKLAVAYGVTTELLDRDYERDDRNRIVRAEVIMRATAPNGRHMDGLGACDITERCCETPCKRRSWNNHTCCDENCDGRSHFSKPGHDLPSTAMTRATNRACADLFGLGEVSAEEVSDRDAVATTEPTRVEVDAVRLAAVEWLRSLDDEAKGYLSAWKDANGLTGVGFAKLEPVIVVKVIAAAGAILAAQGDRPADDPGEEPAQVVEPPKAKKEPEPFPGPDCPWCEKEIPPKADFTIYDDEPYHPECAIEAEAPGDPY